MSAEHLAMQKWRKGSLSDDDEDDEDDDDDDDDDDDYDGDDGDHDDGSRRSEYLIMPNL